jgi:hypothetical protein
MQPCLLVGWIKLAPRQCVPESAWYKASDVDITHYKKDPSQNLTEFDIPFSALSCHNVLCPYSYHTVSIDSLHLGLHLPAKMLHHAQSRKLRLGNGYLVGTICLRLIGSNPCFGIIYG